MQWTLLPISSYIRAIEGQVLDFFNRFFWFSKIDKKTFELHKKFENILEEEIKKRKIYLIDARLIDFENNGKFLNIRFFFEIWFSKNLNIYKIQIKFKHILNF